MENYNSKDMNLLKLDFFPLLPQKVGRTVDDPGFPTSSD